MQEIQYINGFKVIYNCPDYTPEQQKRADDNLLEKLYNIFFNENKDIDTKVKL